LLYAESGFASFIEIGHLQEYGIGIIALQYQAQAA